jgi:hypothetical protein
MSVDLYKEICEKMGEKMGEKKGEARKRTFIYKIRSSRQNAEDSVKHPEVRRRKGLNA